MKSYRDPEVYKVSKELAIKMHKMTMLIPKFELFEEGSQIRRSSKSAASMIVEGYSRRRYKAEFIRYLIFAQSECDETMIRLDFLFETDSLKNEIIFNELRTGYSFLSKRINKFIQWIEDNLNVKQPGTP